MTDSGECGLNQIAGVDTLTMLGGKVEECHDFGSILLQGRRRPRVFGLIGFDEQQQFNQIRRQPSNTPNTRFSHSSEIASLCSHATQPKDGLFLLYLMGS
jgi:hypothetical protein